MEDVLYRDQLLSHYRNPQHYGLRDGFDVESRLENPMCGDAMTVRLKFRGDTVTDVCFESTGCVISKAAGSTTAAYIKGKEKAGVAAMGTQDALRFLGVSMTPGRIKCVTLFLDAVQKMI